MKISKHKKKVYPTPGHLTWVQPAYCCTCWAGLGHPRCFREPLPSALVGMGTKLGSITAAGARQTDGYSHLHPASIGTVGSRLRPALCRWQQETWADESAAAGRKDVWASQKALQAWCSHSLAVLLFVGGPLVSCYGRLWPWGATPTLGFLLSGSSTFWRQATGWRGLTTVVRRCEQALCGPSFPDTDNLGLRREGLMHAFPPHSWSALGASLWWAGWWVVAGQTSQNHLWTWWQMLGIQLHWGLGRLPRGPI